MNSYVVECSECQFNLSHRDQEYIGKVAKQHEQSTGHKGPFVWTLTDELRRVYAEALEERRRRFMQPWMR